MITVFDYTMLNLWYNLTQCNDPIKFGEEKYGKEFYKKDGELGINNAVCFTSDHIDIAYSYRYDTSKNTLSFYAISLESNLEDNYVYTL